MQLVLRYAIMAFAVAYLIWTVWHYFSVKKMAKFLDNKEFSAHLRTGQLVDLREPNSFRRKHILGARNFPLVNLKTSLTALRKDKPVLLYDTTRGAGVARALPILKKAGFTEVYVLKDGIDYWDGKVKTD